MAEVCVGATGCPVVLHELDSGQDALTHWPEQTSKVIDVLKSTIGVVDIQEDRFSNPDNCAHTCLLLALECVLALRKQRTSEEHCPNLGLEVKTPIILPFLGRLSRAVVPRATVNYECIYANAFCPHLSQGSTLSPSGLKLYSTAPIIVTAELPFKLHGDSEPDDHSSLASMPDEVQRLVCRESESDSIDLPLLCVAYKDGIYDAMASGLSQRRFLGVDDPLIGIILNPYDTRLQVVVGWSELNEAHSYHQIHVAHSRSVHVKGGENVFDGTFDMLDRSSAASLALFFLGLSECLQNTVFSAELKSASLVQDLKTRTTIPWRADRIKFNQLGFASSTASDLQNSRQRIIGWREAVDLATTPTTTCKSTEEPTTSSPRPRSLSDPSQVCLSVEDTRDYTGQLHRVYDPDPKSPKALRLIQCLDWSDSGHYPLVAHATDATSASKAASPTSMLYKFDDEANQVLRIPHLTCLSHDRLVFDDVWATPALVSGFPVPKLLTNNGNSTLTSWHFSEQVLWDFIDCFDVDFSGRTSTVNIPKTTVNRFPEESDGGFATFEPTITDGATATPIESYQDKVALAWHKHVKHIQVEKTLRYSIGLKFPSTMRHDVQEKLYLLLPRILNIVESSNNSNDAKGNEAEQRQVWDALCGLVFNDADGSTDSGRTTYHMERIIPLSRNILFDDLAAGSKLPVPYRWAVIEKTGAVSNALMNFEKKLTRTDIKTVQGPELQPEVFRANAVSLRKALVISSSRLQATWTSLSTSTASWTDKDDIVRRALDQYMAGKCDAVAVLHIPGIMPPSLAENARKMFSIIGASSWRAMPKTGRSSRPSKPTLTTHSIIDPTKVVNNEQNLPASLPDLWRSASEMPSSIKEIDQDALHVALFCYEGKKSGGDLVQAFNQNKMNLCSAVHHIASMGLYDVPVFGLVTDGYIGYATCAWGNKASETLDLSPGTTENTVVTVCNKNCPTFDLRIDYQALKFGTYLLNVRYNHVERLLQYFTEHRDTLKERFRMELSDTENRSTLRWTTSHQCEEAAWKKMKKEYDAQLDKSAAVRKDNELKMKWDILHREDSRSLKGNTKQDSDEEIQTNDTLEDFARESGRPSSKRPKNSSGHRGRPRGRESNN